jgi:hypothetical protein
MYQDAIALPAGKLGSRQQLAKVFWFFFSKK